MQKRRVSIRFIIFLLSSLLWCTQTPCLAAPISGTLDEDEIWSGVIEITGNVTVPAGFTLKIEPGSVLRFADSSGLHVYGRLDAIGTTDNPITFTSASAAPGKGIWTGISFYDSSLDVSVIGHAVIEYASKGVWCEKANPAIRNSVLANNLIGVSLLDSSSAITDCIIRDNQDHGVYIDRSSWSVIRNNHITHCSNGIYVHGGYYGGPTIQNNIIRNHAGYGIYVGPYHSPTISFNTLDVNGVGIYFRTSISYTTTILSNIITSCNTGIQREYASYILSCNDLWDNAVNYNGVTPGATDLAIDPSYVDPLIADIRLQQGSPLLHASQNGGEIGAFGAGGGPPLLTLSYPTVPTTAGSLGQNEVWSGLIEITGNVTVPFGVMLRVEPGTVLHFANNTGLHVYGRLDAVGRADSPITFTSASAAPGKGIWSGITFYDSSLDVSVVDHTVIEYASRGVSCGKAHPTIRNSVLANNLIGVYLSDSSSSIIGCIIRDNQDHGVYIDRSSWSSIANNHITRNSNGIYANDSYYGGPTIQNNIIRNHAGYGIHVGAFHSSTISFNTLDVNGIGIYFRTGNDYNTTIFANIITSCNTGIQRKYGRYSLSCNDLWSNAVNYDGVTPGATDLAIDPHYADALVADVRLQEGSSLLRASQDGGQIGAFGAGGTPPLLMSSYSAVPTTSGSLAQNEVWSGLLEITGNVTVPFGVVLRVEPGTVMRFANNTGLHIYGKLDAVGTTDNPITFTSTSTVPTRGIWSGIYFYDSSLDLSVIDHALIEYASRGVWCGEAQPVIRNSILANNLIGVLLSDSSSSITGCIIRDNRDHGVYLERTNWSWIANNHITRCNNGIYVFGGYAGSPTIRNNIIRNNVNYGIHIGLIYSPTISFNTLVANGIGINLYTGSGYKSTISSNIITSCNTGIAKYSGECSLTYNDVWHNGSDYFGTSAGDGDISSDPLYTASEDFRLQSGSPCLDAGDPSLLDEDGTRADMGAYGGSGGAAPPPGDVSPHRPINSLPEDGALGVSPSLMLKATPFSDPDMGDSHVFSRWQIRAASGSYELPVFDSGESTTSLLSIRIPWGALQPGTTYFWHVRYKDNKNGWSDYSLETSFTTLQDEGPPDTAITSGPDEGGVASGTTTFSWAGSDAAGEPLVYSFAMDLGGWSSFYASTMYTFQGLSEGLHTFYVRARDYSGNVDPTPAVRNFRVDRTAPLISEVVLTRVTNKLAVVSWQTNEPATTQTVYGTSPSYGSGTSQENTLVTTHTATLANLKADTLYHFAVVSRDQAGNQAKSADFTFRTLPAVDETPPETTITVGPQEGALLNAAQVTLGWAGWDDISEPSRLSYAYRLDLEGWSPFGSATSHTFANLADGEHAIAIKARDEAQNEDPTPAVRTFTVDTTPPAPATGLAATTTPDGATLHWSHSSSPDIHSYRLYWNQGAGAIDYAAVLAAVNHPAGMANVTIHHKGVYQIGLRAVDCAGNEEKNSTLVVTVNLSRPDAPTLQPVTSPTDARTQLLAGTKDANTSLWLNGAQVVPLSSSTSWSYEMTLIEGVNRIELTCRNEAGEESPSVAAVIDYESPPLPVANLTASGSGPGTTVALSWAGYDEKGQGDIASYRVYVADHSFSQVAGMPPRVALPAGTFAYTATGLVRETIYHFAVVAVDTRGNALNAVTPVAAMPTDTAAPENVIALSAQCFADRLIVSWDPSANSARDLAGYKVYFNRSVEGIPVDAGRNSFEQAGLTPATAYPFTITAVDTSGNESSGSAIEAITLLDNPPQLTIQPHNGRLGLSWADSQPRAYVARYYLYLSESSFTSVAGMTPRTTTTGTSASIAGLTNDKTYYCAVTAVNLSGGEKKEVVARMGTPVGDKEGPVIADVRFESALVVSGMEVKHSGTFSLTAADPSGMSRVEFRFDGNLYHTTTTASPRYTCTWDITRVADGDHLLAITAYDTLGNASTVTFNLVVALNPPQPPVIIYPSGGQLVNDPIVIVSGRTEKNTEVLLFDNNLQAGNVVTADASGSFTVPLTLVEGENHLQAAARNRAGMSPRCAEVIVTLDSTRPQGPTGLAAIPKAGGMIALTWRMSAETALRGFNLYRAANPFFNTGGAAKINAMPLTTTSFDDLPPADGTYYYRVSSVDRAGNESDPSDLVAAASDRTPPRALAVDYLPSGRFDPVSGRMSVGAVSVRVSLSEPVQTTPFLSITPHHGTPVTVDLSKSSETEFSGMFSITDATPSGRAYAVFSARDAVGNRGTAVEAGAELDIDTTGPALTLLTVEPHAPILNDESSPALITVTIGLNEAVKSGSLPQLSYLLSKAGRTPAAISGLMPIAAQSGQVQSFQATFVLPADAGLAEVETLQFSCRGADDLDNVGTRILAQNRFQVYQGELPPVDAPEGFAAKSLPAGQIKLSWVPREGAAGYQLYRMGPGESVLSAYTRTGKIGEWLDSPSVDGRYTYAIASVRQENGQETVGGMSAPVEVDADSLPPGSPRSLTLELLSQGANAVWQPPLGTTEPVTYALYRANLTEITSVAGLTPLTRGISGTTVLDPHPSATDHCYVVTAVDRAGNESAPSNAFYLNCKLLPISSLRVVQNGGSPPVISWTHPAGLSAGLAGFNLSLGSGGTNVKLNQTPVAAMSYTDAGYSGDERVYTVSAVDANAIESLGRSITLPVIRASLKAGEALQRGVMNRLTYTVEDLSSGPVEHGRLKAGVGPHLHTSEEFRLDAGEARDVHLAVGGFADLADSSTLVTTIVITPHEGESVEISRTGSIEVTDGMLVLQIVNEELTRGLSGQVQFTLENTGEEELEIVTATGAGASASNEISFQLLDLDGNVLVTAPFRQSLGTQIVTLANGNTVARIPAGSVFTSTAVDLPVPLNAPEQAVIRLSLAKLYYHQGKPEQVSMEGPATRQVVSFADTAYYGEITQVDPAVSNGDRDVLLAGHAIERRTGLPLGGVPLKVVVTLNGFERTREVLTDVNGAFSYPFKPLATECGVYSVRAVHPEVRDKPVQAQFTINRVSVTPQTVNLSMPRNYEKWVAIQVAASQGTEVHNLRLVYDAADQPEGVLPEGVHVSLGAPVAVLGSGRSASPGFNIWADNTAAGMVRLVLRVTSDEKGEGAWAMVTLVMSLSEARPVLSCLPDHVETGSAFGETVFETITLENKGLVDLNGVSLALLSKDGSTVPGWAQLNSDAAQGTIPVGEKRLVSLSFRPTEATAVEGDHAFLLRVVSSNHRTVEVPVYVAVTQSGTGQVIFKVSDIYTGTIGASGKIVQGLKSAAITLQHETVTTIQKNAATDDLGELYLAGLPSGRYQYRVSAVDHQERTGRIWVKAGVAANEAVFLDYNLVSVEWEVKETTIQDKYEIVLKVSYEADVPAAVLVAQPSSIYLPEMKPGDVYQGEFNLANHGLIRADNVAFTLPSTDAGYRYELAGGVPDTIEAKGQQAIPYRVTRLAVSDGDGGSSCLRTLQSATISYDYGCAAGTRTAALVPFAFLYDNGHCTGQTPTVPGGGSSNGGGGGSWVIVVPPGGGEGGGGGIVPRPPPAPIAGAKCLPLPERQEAMTGRPPTCPLDTQQDVLQEVGSAVNGALREFTDHEEDLSVKVPGGNIAVTRFFYGNLWRWEAMRNNLVFTMDSLGQAVKSIDKGGVRYERSAAQSVTPVFVHDTYRITQVESGFLWEDKHGAWRSFDHEGRMTAYGNPSGVLGRLLYGSGENGKLFGIADRNDRQVIWFEVDDEGRITAAYDLANRRVEYGYRDGLLTSVRDVLGNLSTYEYDAKGRLVKKIDAAGHTESISYDAYGNVAKVADSQGHGHAFQFDYDSGRKQYYARITTAAGMVKEVWYDRDGETERVDVNGRTVRKIVKDGRNRLVTDDRGNVTRKDFDEWRNLTRVVYPDGATVSFEYEHQYNQRVSTTDERGARTEFAYDAAGNLISKIEAKGTSVQRETRHRYDSQGNPVETRRMADAITAEAVTVMEYDTWGNLITMTDPESHATSFTHDVMGNVLTKTDAGGKVWSTSYDAAGRATAITDPLGHTTTFAYDAVGNKIRETDVEGREKAFGYDEHHRLVSSTDTAGNVTRFEYNAAGKLTRQIDPEGKVLEYAYDSEGRLIKAMDGNGNQTQVEYEGPSSGCAGCSGPTDQPSKIVYPTFTKEFRYDSRGRKIEERDRLSEAETHTTTFAYDSAGNLTSTTDKESKTTRHSYDELNRLVKTTDAGGHETLFAYDSRDNLVALTDPRGNTTRFAYDRNNRQIREVRPLSQATLYGYDGSGRLIKKIDAKSQWSEYEYDDAGRLTHTRYYSASDHATSLKTVVFDYDRLGHLVSYEDGVTSGRYEYDDAYRKVLETVDYGAFQLSSTTGWYRNGAKKDFTGPDGVTYAYEYDANNQLRSLEVPGKGFITYNAYTWNRPALITYPGGTAREVTYDPLMRITSIRVKDPAEEVLMNYGYTYDRMNNITRKATEHGDYAYGYDDVYQLIQADNPTLPDETYTYDSAGNRLTAADVQGEWTYNANNELQTYGAVTYRYDENGNTVQKDTGGDVVNYFYDVQNQLTRVESGAGSVIAQYYYDPFGRRLWKEVGTEKTYFAYADEGLIGEFDGTGHQTKAYGYRPGSTWTTDPLFMKDGEEYYFYHNDHLGTPMQLAAESGAVVWEGKYFSFGYITIPLGSILTNNIRFPGQYYDQETGFYYNFHRYYGPEPARYFIPDLIGHKYGQNLYVYAVMNPVKICDSMGLWSSDPSWPVHQVLGWMVFGEVLSSDELAIINEAHIFADSEAFQDGNYAYRHAMKGAYESKATACQKARRFVKEEFNKAFAERRRGDIESSLFHFGLALHTIQDSTSPTHEAFQQWTGKETTYQEISHVLRGDLFPFSPALLNATINAWEWYTTGNVPEFIFDCQCVD